MRRPPALAAALLVSLLVASAPLSPLPALARPATRALPAVVVPSPDDDIPGVPLTDSPVTGSLSDRSDSDDVFSIRLLPGQTLAATLTAPAGTSFALDLYGPNAKSAVNGDKLPVASSAGDAYPQRLVHTAGSAGTYHLDVSTWGGAGGYRLEWSVRSSAGLALARDEGLDRYRTAVAVSRHAFASGETSTVVLTAGAEFADALAASSLAGSYGCPILLTGRTGVPGPVLAEIARLAGESKATVLLVGGEGSIPDTVATRLEERGMRVERVGGADRYETAARVAERVARHEREAGRAAPARAFVVDGSEFTGALAAAPFAAGTHVPVLLVRPGAIPTATSRALRQLDVTGTCVVGGRDSVSDNVVRRLPGAERVAGSSRYETSRLLAEWALRHRLAEAGTVGLATGDAFPDALTGAALLGRRSGVLLLTGGDSLAPAAARFLRTHHSDVTTLCVFGSEDAVGEAAFADALRAVR